MLSLGTGRLKSMSGKSSSSSSGVHGRHLFLSLRHSSSRLRFSQPPWPRSPPEPPEAVAAIASGGSGDLSKMLASDL